MTPNEHLNNDNFIEFSCEMDAHIMTDSTFFNQKILDLLEKIFNYENVCFSIYENGTFTGAITKNKLNYVLKEYLINYNEKDNVAKAITNRISKFKYSNPTEVILGTDVITSPTYELSDYAKFYSAIGLLYVAVCPINENFRLCVYKEKEQGNFSDIERNNLLNITKIIVSKYYIYLKLQEEEYRNKFKNLMLDKNSHGFIILNDILQPIDYNFVAVEHLNELLDNKFPNNTNICILCKKFLKLLNETPDNENSVVKVINNFKIKFFINTKTDEYNFVTKYYYLSIKKLGAENATNNKATLISLLSKRALEVVDYLSGGLSYNQISEKLFISLNTVRTHIKNIYKKIDIDNQRSLIQIYNSYCKMKDNS